MVVEPDSPQRIARLTPLSDVLARLDGLVRPVPARASDLSGALGSTLAEDVVANAPVPATARALRDGWAVRADHTTDAGTYHRRRFLPPRASMSASHLRAMPMR